MKKACDTEFSLFIRERDRICQKCLRGPDEVQLQCAHIVSRSYTKTRWYPPNAMALCSGCHVTFTHWPLEWEGFVVARIGEDEYRRIKLMAQETGWHVDYESMLADIRRWREEGFDGGSRAGTDRPEGPGGVGEAVALDAAAGAT